MNWSRYYMRQEKFEFARRYLGMAKQHLPGDTRLLGVESDIAAAEGKLEDAIRLLRELMQKTAPSVYLERRIGVFRDFLRRGRAGE